MMKRSGEVTGQASEEAGLRKVAFRLAAQTVGLLFVMLLVLEIVLYLFTQRTLLDSLQTTLKNRANQPDPAVCNVLRLSCGIPGPRPQGGTGQTGQGPFTGRGSRSQIPPPTPASVRDRLQPINPSEASAVFFDRSGKVVHADGALLGAVLDRAAVRTAISTGRTDCCGSRHYKGEDYLSYTAPLRARNHVVGAVQTSVSENQYENTMQTLLEVLALVAILGLLGSGVISALLARRALQPIRVAMTRQRDFVADAAHELRTPLAIMRTVGEVGIDESSPDDLQATIAQMLGENQHLTRLVEDLSLLARSDTGAVDLERNEVDLATLAHDTVNELSPVAQGEGVELRGEIQEGVHTLGDKLRLRQLILILLDNALKHTPSGGAVILNLSAHHDRARLRVTDTGPGIPPTDLPRIFDRFYRADHAREGEGSGLGLAIGKWIAEAHGGHIQAGNASPRGASFTVTLPLQGAA